MLRFSLQVFVFGPPGGKGSTELTQDTLEVRFLSQNEQTAVSVGHHIAQFIQAARSTLDIAVYDMRLSGPLRDIIASALDDRARAGVRIRIAYDAEKPEQPDLLHGADPAESGTEQLVESLGYDSCGIDGRKLMHHKYIVRDAGLPNGAVWTGSTNFTDDSWTLQENNILHVYSARIAGWYARNFAELWEDGNFEGSGDFTTEPVDTLYKGEPASIRVEFSPGRGEEIGDRIAAIVQAARSRILICSMLLNASSLLQALESVLNAGDVSIAGVYDRTQQASVLDQWETVPHNTWKIPAIREIVAKAGLVGKNSTPYSPTTPHDFMHAKVLIVDDTVISGSYNFSRSATLNAENILIIDSPALAADYASFISHLIQKYRPASIPL